MSKRERLPIGGYTSTKKYGRPDYCPSATRQHLKAKEVTGKTPDARWFHSAREAISEGHSPCGNCWLVGEEAFSRWQEYLSLCRELAVKPIATPKRILFRLGKIKH